MRRKNQCPTCQRWEVRDPHKAVKQCVESLNKVAVKGEQVARGEGMLSASCSKHLTVKSFNFSLVWQASGESTHTPMTLSRLLNSVDVPLFVWHWGYFKDTLGGLLLLCVRQLLVAYRCTRFNASVPFLLVWEEEATNTVFIRLFQKLAKQL